ncbi:universal stress protein [Thiohalorhabdus sp. Cl-TMA]|uniref:Universal stress protein n=1 Tax=Thiohalorhabdus methylotrophus TaxID=3242694 RepID=A0ABV4TR35_9GAMM
MSGVRRILVATDFSAQAERAARRAMALAPADGTIHLLFVLPTGLLERIREVLGMADGDAARRAALAQAEERMEALRARLGAGFAGTLSASVEEGHPKLAISEYARAHGFDLVVAGAFGEGGNERLLSGVTAQKVVRSADRPVLLVRSEDHPGRAYRRVLVAVDFSEASRKALQWALDLCPEATVYVLHVFELPFEGTFDLEAMPWEVAERYRQVGHEQSREGLERFLAAFDGQRCRPLVRQGNPARVILGQAESQEVDLVAVGSRGLGPWTESLLGSVNVHLMQRCTCDLLTVRP